MSYKINVYLEDPSFESSTTVARVSYNQRRDYWDGSNMGNGGTGMHKGITKLKKPTDPKKPYVIIIGSQWQGATDYGFIVTPQEAAQHVLESNAFEDEWMWDDLKEICNSFNSEEI